MDADLDALIRRVEAYIQLINTDLDPQLTTLLHRYICILFTANIDKAVQIILTEFARIHGTEELRRFVSKKHTRGTNYNTERIVQTLNYFDSDWGKRFLEDATRTGLKEQIDAMYGIRNSISHGEVVNISRPTLDGYNQAHRNAIKVIKEIVL